MIQFLAADLAHDWQWLLAEKNSAWEKANNPELSTPNQLDINRLNGLLKGDERLVCRGLLHFCEILEMEKSMQRLKHFVGILNITNGTPNFHVVHSELMGLENSLWEELRARRFAFIPTDKIEFFERGNLFGDIVGAQFSKECLKHIEDAGNCLATDLNTASVFHLMCAVNFGLVSLATLLGVRIKKTPLDFAEWGPMIGQIESKLNQKSINPGGNKKAQTETRTFCNECLVIIKAFKDQRNSVMHARKRYSEIEAKRIFGEVREFMEHLATKLSEKKRSK